MTLIRTSLQEVMVSVLCQGVVIHDNVYMCMYMRTHDHENMSSDAVNILYSHMGCTYRSAVVYSLADVCTEQANLTCTKNELY